MARTHVRQSLTRLVASAGLGLGLVAAHPAPALAASIALDVTSATAAVECNPTTNPGCSVGWAFQVNSPIAVESLGFFDLNFDGLVESHDVGIFDSNGALIASATITNGSTPVASAASFGHWLFEDIDNVTLQPGQYTIGAFVTDLSADRIVSNAVIATMPQITYLGGRANFDESSLHDPVNGPFDGFEPSLFGPTFTARAVPEPSTLLLVGAGALALLRRRRA